MFGKTYGPNLSVNQRFDNQLETTYAAMQLSKELESIDFIDLGSAAIVFYNKLTTDINDRIQLQWVGRDHSPQQRQWVIEYNWYMLKNRYNESKYTDPLVIPATVKDALIKIQWLSFKQLPENDNGWIKAKAFLNWDTLQIWLQHVHDSLF